MPKIKDSNDPKDKRQVTTHGRSKAPVDPQTGEERNDELLQLLGEVIRMSQAWAAALESGDPFTADKHEAACLRAMERFEANRKAKGARSTSFEETR